MSEITATPISAAMMTSSAWRPYLLGLGLTFVFSALTPLMPETLQFARKKALEVSSTEDHERGVVDGTGGASDAPDRGAWVGSLESFKSLDFMLRNTNVLLLLSVIFVGNLSKQSTGLLILYPSTRYHWIIGQVSSSCHQYIFSALQSRINLTLNTTSLAC
jgi:hypothetical protein